MSAPRFQTTPTSFGGAVDPTKLDQSGDESAEKTD